MSENKRMILHVDMDHFFTAIEERENSAHKGRPIVVGADPREGKGRGVVSTCNYEARDLGIRSGMPISRAWKLCPEAVYLPVNYTLYKDVSDEIMKILRKYAEKFEKWGLDEAFLDVTSKVDSYEEAASLTRRIKSEIFSKEGLTCSIGVGPNKLVAKMASDFKKPDGLTIVREDEVNGFLSFLPVRKLLWVGRKMEGRLRGLGVKTIGDLARFDPTILVEKFGNVGRKLYLMAHGINKGEVEERKGVRSISKETTFDEDISDSDLVLETLEKLSEKVHENVVKQNLNFKTVSVKVRFENFETHTRTKTLPFVTNRLQDLQKNAKGLIQDYLELGRKIRLVGVRASRFTLTGKQKKLIFN